MPQEALVVKNLAATAGNKETRFDPWICLPLQETWVWSLSQEDPLEKGMATHSSILAWEIPWTEQPGGLQSMKLQKVRHNWLTKHHHHYYYGKLSWSFTCFGFAVDGIQEMIPQNMAIWHTEYFKLKESEETGRSGSSLCPPVLHPRSHSWPSGERNSPFACRKERNILISKMDR